MAEKHTIEKLLPDPDSSVVGSLLISPDHDTIQEAIAADIVDAIPIGGDMLLLVRADRADRKGLNFPDDQAYVENVMSDLPPPFDTALDLLVSPNTVRYVEKNRPVEIVDGVELEVFEDEELGIKLVLPSVTGSVLPDPADHLPV